MNQLRDLLDAIRQSINEEYLVPNWHYMLRKHNTKIVRVYNEHPQIYFASIHDSALIGGEYWHIEKALEEGDIVYCEIYDSYEFTNDVVAGYYYSRNNQQKKRSWMNGDDATYCHCDGNWYYHEDLGEFNIVQCEDDDRFYFSDNLYYWESDDSYHLEEEEEEEDDCNLLDYHSGEGREMKINKSGFTIGLEIEKAERPDTMNWREIYNKTGWVAESDGSVPDGFELVSPTYDLFNSEIFNDIDKLKEYINIQNINNCGGHINFGIVGKGGQEVLQQITGFIPLIYSMYAKRLKATYCVAKKTKELDCDKYSSIRIRYNYIEFRIISAVECVEQLKWRIELFRLIAKHAGSKFNQIALKLATKGTDLNDHFTAKGSPYNDASKFQQMLKRSVRFNQEYNDHIPTSQESINYITKKIAKVCA